MQPAPRWRDFNVGAFVVREKSASGLVGDAMLIEAAVEVDTADAVPEDEPQGSASRTRGRMSAPRARIGDRCPTAGARAHRALVEVINPSGAVDELGGQHL